MNGYASRVIRRHRLAMLAPAPVEAREVGAAVAVPVWVLLLLSGGGGLAVGAIAGAAIEAAKSRTKLDTAMQAVADSIAKQRAERLTAMQDVGGGVTPGFPIPESHRPNLATTRTDLPLTLYFAQLQKASDSKLGGWDGIKPWTSNLPIGAGVDILGALYTDIKTQAKLIAAASKWISEGDRGPDDVNPRTTYPNREALTLAVVTLEAMLARAREVVKARTEFVQAHLTEAANLVANTKGEKERAKAAERYFVFLMGETAAMGMILGGIDLGLQLSTAVRAVVQLAGDTISSYLRGWDAAASLALETTKAEYDRLSEQADGIWDQLKNFIKTGLTWGLIALGGLVLGPSFLNLVAAKIRKT